MVLKAQDDLPMAPSGAPSVFAEPEPRAKRPPAAEREDALALPDAGKPSQIRWKRLRDHIYAATVEFYEAEGCRIGPRELHEMDVAMHACKQGRQSWWLKFKRG